METLLVKCPQCETFIDLGTRNCLTYKKSIAFSLDMKCPNCEDYISESDTSESDYRVVNIDTILEQAKIQP